MKGRNCLKATVKKVDGEEQVLCRFSLIAFKKMQPCVGDNCGLDDEIAEWEGENDDKEKI